jgi:hypothetical protein
VLAPCELSCSKNKWNAFGPFTEADWPTGLSIAKDCDKRMMVPEMPAQNKKPLR